MRPAANGRQSTDQGVRRHERAPEQRRLEVPGVFRREHVGQLLDRGASCCAHAAEAGVPDTRDPSRAIAIQAGDRESAAMGRRISRSRRRDAGARDRGSGALPGERLRQPGEAHGVIQRQQRGERGGEKTVVVHAFDRVAEVDPPGGEVAHPAADPDAVVVRAGWR